MTSHPSSEARFPEKAKDMILYEVNIRQYTPEGTIAAFRTHLPRLKKLGVDILWIMPVQPIGEAQRKGTLGSYYSIKDYVSVNPEFGTIDDFKALVKQAHDMGMYVILDWVANHTAFDHEWIADTAYYVKDSLGTIKSPVEDWTDVADLNYNNASMREDMIASMRFWVDQADIDGFRCDVAGMVPNSFWKAAVDSLRQIKNLFLLAEWDEPMIHDNFQVSYAWGTHHMMNDIAKGEKEVTHLQKHLQEDKEKYGDHYRMLFITNHDENSWNGTIEERLGEGHQAYAVLTFTLNGMPLIYSGQEAGLDKRLRFFDKDTIHWDDYRYQDFYQSLIRLKKENAALWAGDQGGDVLFLDSGDPLVAAYTREKGENKVVVIANLSKEEKKISLSGIATFDDYFTQEAVNPESHVLAPYQFFVGIISK